MLAGSVLMSMCYRLGIKDFFFFSPLRNTHGYGFTDLALNDLLSQLCIFNPKTNQLVRLDYIKNQFQKTPPYRLALTWERIWPLTPNCKKSY